MCVKPGVVVSGSGSAKLLRRLLEAELCGVLLFEAEATRAGAVPAVDTRDEDCGRELGIPRSCSSWDSAGSEAPAEYTFRLSLACGEAVGELFGLRLLIAGEWGLSLDAAVSLVLWVGVLDLLLLEASGVLFSPHLLLLLLFLSPISVAAGLDTSSRGSASTTILNRGKNEECHSVTFGTPKSVWGIELRTSWRNPLKMRNNGSSVGTSACLELV